jgi:sugar-specific transcriptional regulator TrmB
VSQERILQILIDIGFTQMDSRVYLFLSKKGSQRARNISNALKLTKNQLYTSLKSLESNGVISVTFEHPARFSAVPFEKVLDIFVKTKMEEAQRIQHSKNQILSDWHSIELAESDRGSPKFMIIEGRNAIYSKIRLMIDETKKQLSIATSARNLVQADQLGLFESGLKRFAKSKGQFRFLVETAGQDVNIMKNYLKRSPKSKVAFEGRIPDLGLKLSPRMVLRDKEEILLFIASDQGITQFMENEICLWTNCEALVNSFQTVFEDWWSKSTDINHKITEIETGKSAFKTLIINSGQTSQKKYEELLNSAKQEVMMVTSGEGLVNLAKKPDSLKKLTARGVTIKIMAPITDESLKASTQLASLCEVRHATEAYLKTTIIDGQHLFQFKSPLPKTENSDSEGQFENTFYTDDIDHVRKTKNMLNSLWKNAYAPSNVTLQSIAENETGVIAIFSEELTAHKPIREKLLGNVINEKSIAEKEIINKIINAKRYPVKTLKDTAVYYGSSAMGIIHTPSHLNLPEILVNVFNFEKQSSFGAEDWLLVSLLLETKEGPKYVPVAHVTDNAKAAKFRRELFTGAPAEKNFRIVKKKELQVRVHGNTLFVAWTVKIPLFPSNNVLPPSSILFEGYGEVKSNAYTKLSLSSRKQVVEYNRLDSFITFFHPKAKYTGPGTDGCFYRELIFSSFPHSTK